MKTHRPIHDIARDITRDWTRPYFGAVPYLRAMHTLTKVEENYGVDSASSILNGFLANASTWRGPLAREIKAELKALLK